jgi:hypothetical protein
MKEQNLGQKARFAEFSVPSLNELMAQYLSCPPNPLIILFCNLLRSVDKEVLIYQ